MKRTLLSLCLTFITVLALHADDFYNVLEVDFENGLPAGWTQEYVQRPVTQSANENLYSWFVESGDSLTFPNMCVSGTHRAKAANSTNQEMRFVTRLITPPMNLSGVFQPQLIFSHAEPRRISFCDTLRVYYRANAAEVWRPLPQAVYTNEASWKQSTLPLVTQSPNISAYQIAFEITESMGRGVVLDDIIVRPTPTCLDVENIVCSRVHAYDATLSWDAPGSYNEFQVLVADTVLDLQHIDQSHVVFSLLEDVYNPSAFVSGLSPETNYYVYVRSDCDENESGFTNWVSTSFRTLKVAYLPYRESFNQSIALSANNQAFGLPDGWTAGNNLGIKVPYVPRMNLPSQNAVYSVDSTAYLAFVGDSASVAAIPASKYVYAVSPEIVDTLHPGASLQGLQIRFWLTAANYVSLGAQNYASSLIVGTISDPQDYTTFHPLDTVHIDATSLFRHVTVNLDNYTGSDRFVALATRFNMANAMFVDNFTLSVPEAPVPADVVVNRVSSTGFTVKPSLHGATSWDLLVSSEYSRTGNVSAGSVVAQHNALTAASFAVNSDTLANHILHIYTRTHKGSAVSEWSFAQTVRIPELMPVLTDSTKFALNFNNGNRLPLNKLNQELRLANNPMGLSEVYYTLGALDDEINTYPKYVNVTAHNYRNAHMELRGADSWFVLPEATDLNTLKMVFRHSSIEGKQGKLAVGVMTDPYDLSTFEQVAVFTAEGYLWERRLVSFDAYTGTGRFIAVRSLNAGSGVESSTNLIDEMEVSKLGSCREASNVVIEAHSDHAEVSWNGGGMDGWIVGLAAQRNMMNATYTAVNVPNITLNNLTELTTYYVSIQQICGNDTASMEDLDEVRYTFTTPQGLPFVEPFATTALPEGWFYCNYKKASAIFSGTEMTPSSSASSYCWNISSSSSYVHSPLSGNVAYFNMTSSSDYGWLVSPELYVDADPDKPLELVFDLGMSSYTSSYSSSTTGEAAPDEVFMVVVSEDGGNTWSRSNATVWNNTGDGDYVLNDLIWDGGEQVKIDFSNYIGKHIKIGFYVESTLSSYRNYLCIDNITLRVGDERCGGLKNLRAQASSITNATATWQLAGQNPWPAIIQLSDKESFATILHSDTLTASTISYSDLEANKTYYVRARQQCENGGGWQIVTFHTPCTAITPEEFGMETFDTADALDCWTVGFEAERTSGQKPQATNVAGFGGVLQIAKTSTDTTASDAAYAILPELELDDNVKDISHYQLIFKAGTNSRAEKNVAHLQIYILTDPTDITSTWSNMGEIRLQYAADSTQLKTYVVSFEDYIGDLQHDGEMGHYVMFYSQAGTDSLNYVIIDDVMLSDVEGCHMVIDMEADSATIDGGRLHWSGNGSQYEVAVSATRVNPDTCTTWLSHQIVSGNSCRVHGLEATSTYYAYIRAICGDTAVSRWSSATYLETLRGVPYYEPFDSLANLYQGDYRSYSGVFTQDSLVIQNYATSSTWTVTTPESSIKGMSGKAAYMNIWSTNKGYWFILPTLDVSNVGEDVIKFSALVALCKYSGNGTPDTSNDDRLGVLVSRDGGKTWLKSDATFWASDGTGQYAYNFGLAAKRIEVDLTPYAGGSVTIAVYGESTVSNADNKLYVDDVRVERISSVCMGVQDAKVTLAGATSAVAKWNIIGTPKEVVYALSDDESFSTVLLSDTAKADSVVLNNLTLDRLYYLRLTQVGCTNSATVQFRTPHAIPFEQPFTAMPDDWTIMTGNADSAMAGVLPQLYISTTTWKISNTAVGQMANHLLGEISTTSVFKEKWLVSPDVVIPAGSENVKLQFDAAYTAHGKTTAPDSTKVNGQEFRILVSTDGGQSWTQQWVYSDAATAYGKLAEISATGTRIQLPMDNFAGRMVRFAFYKAAAANDNDLHIANVKLAEFGEPCDKPTDLHTTEITFTSATIAWQGVEDKATIIEYGYAADFTNAKADTIASGLTYTLNNLLAEKTYFVRVRQLCGVNSMSENSESIQFTMPVGIPYVNDLSSLGEWKKFESPIAGKLGGTRKTTTSGWTTSTADSILNADHIRCSYSTSKALWLISPTIDLTPQQLGDNLRLSIDLAVTTSSTSIDKPTMAAKDSTKYLFYIAVSTDERDTFMTANAWEFSNVSTAAYRLSDMPGGAGKTYRLDFSRFAGQKIRIALVSMNTKTQTCMNAARLKLDIAGSSCFGVKRAELSAIDTAATVTLLREDGDAGIQWQVAYGKQGTELEHMSSRIFDALTGRIGGLELTSTYDLYARSICGVGDTSEWSGPYSFETPLGLPFNEPFASASALNNWSRYVGKADSVFAGTDSLLAVSSGWTALNSTTAALSAAHVYCAQSTTKDNWLVSPEINLMPQDGSKSIWLSFNAALTSTEKGTFAPVSATGHTFRIVVSENGGATWTAANSILWGDSITGDYIYTSIPAGNGKAYHLDLTRYAGKKIRLALVQGSAAAGTSYIHINKLELAEYDVPCFGVEGFTVAMDGFTAACTIADGNTASTAWQYAYGAKNFTPVDSQWVTVNSKKFNIELPASSTIDIYVRALCGANDTSAYVGPQRVSTPLGIPYYEPFSSPSSGLPTGWSTTHSDSYGQWKITTSSSVWGVAHAKTNNWSTNNAQLYSPEINILDTKNAVELSFDLALTATGSSNAPSNPNNQTFDVRVSTNGGQTFDDPLAVWGTINDDYVYASIPNAGERYTVDLSDYIGSSIVIGFFSTSISGAGDNDLHLKDLRLDTVGGSGSVCTVVKSMSVADSSFHSATVVFRGRGVSDALAFEYICIPEGSIFNPSRAVRIDTNIVTIKDLYSSNGYEVFARMMCPDSLWSDWNGPWLFHTVECSSVASITPLLVSKEEVVVKAISPDSRAAYGYLAGLVPQGQPLATDSMQFFRSDTLHFMLPMEANVKYDVYVSKICEIGDTSLLAGPFAVEVPKAYMFFESFNHSGTALPEGWETTHTSSFGEWKIGNHSGVFGRPHAYTNNYSSNNCWLISPEISTVGTMNEMTLSFDLALTAYNSANPPSSTPNQSFAVCVSTDGGRTFSSPVAEWTPNGTLDYTAIPVDGERYTVDLSSYIGSSIRLGFYASSVSGDCDLHLGNVALDTATVSCGVVQQIEAVNVGLSSAKLTYVMPEGSSSSAILQVAKDAAFTQLVAMETVNTLSYQLQGLEASTTYYVRLMNICSDGESRWSTPISFRTTTGVRYIEDFNEATTYAEWTQSTTPTSEVFSFNTLTESTSGQKWSRKTTHTNIFPTAHPEMNVDYSTYSANTGWLISPMIDLTPNAGQGLLLGFDLALCAYSDGGAPQATTTQSFYVVISEDGGKTWDAANSTSWGSSGANDYAYSDLNIQPIRYILDMSQYGGKQIKIGFCAEITAEGGDNYIMIDNVDLNAAISLEYTDTICQFEDYDMHGFHYDADELQLGMNEFRIISQGFDSVTHLNIYVNELATFVAADTICEGESYTGHGFVDLKATQSGSYNTIIAGTNGCDGLMTLNLTVLPKLYEEVYDTLCDGSSFTFKDRTYYHDVIVRDTLSSALTGCDSIVTYYVTFSANAVARSEVYAIICAGQRYRDALFSETETGVYYETTASLAGCDSIVTLYLTVTDAEGAIYDTISVDDLPYIYQGEQLIPEGAEAKDYVFPLESVNEGCSPELRVHVEPKTGLESVQSLQLSVAPNPVQVGEPLYILTDIPAGADFTATVFNAIGQQVYTVSEFTTELPALHTSGIYMVRVVSGKKLYEGKILVK